MGIFDRLLAPFRAPRADDSEDDRSPWGSFWFEPVGIRAAAGMRVTAESALRLSPVYACVRLIAETFATLPFKLYSIGADGGRTPVADHWIIRLLTRRPNAFQNAFEWREMMQGHLALRGNCYNRITADGRGQITDLTPIHPDRIKVQLTNEDGTDYRYVVTRRDGSSEPVPRGEIWHLRGLSSDGIIGISPIALARESIGVGLAAQDYGARFFQNDASPMSGWVEFPGTFKDKTARDVFRESLHKAQGGRNRGKTYVLERGMKWHEVGMKNNDSQFLETRKFQVTDIARIFRIPPHMIADLDRATNNNIEQMSLEFVKYCMTPWAERWEASIEHELLLEGIDDALEAEFDFDELIRGDMAARANFYTAGINAGWLTRNEARKAELLAPIDGLNEPLRALNMIPNDQEPDANAPGQGAEPGELPTPTKASARAIAFDARRAALEKAAIDRILRKEKTAASRGADVFDDKHAAFVSEVLAVERDLADEYCAARRAGAGAGEDALRLLIDGQVMH